MPYVPVHQRLVIGRPLHNLVDVIRDYPADQRDGIINYCITVLILQALRPPGGWRYRSLQRAFGLLQCCTQEFYRRIIGPYEDKAIRTNGDVVEIQQFLTGINPPPSCPSALHSLDDDLCDE